MSETIKRAESTSKTHLQNIMQIAVFGLNDKNLYGINISKIRSIEDFKKYEIIKNNTVKSELLEGFIRYQNAVIPVVNIEKWLKIYNESNIYLEFLVCEYNKERIAFPISGIRNIFNVSVESLQTPDSMFDAVTYNAVVEVDGIKTIVLVLDVEKILFDLFGANYEVPQDGVASGKKILIAEDSRTAQEIIKDIMQTSSVDFTIFDNGEELISHIESLSEGEIEEIGLIITDLEMPKKDGYQVIKFVREHKNTNHLPVVVNTSMSDQGVISKTLSLGADGFVAKTDPESFIATVKKYIRS